MSSMMEGLKRPPRTVLDLQDEDSPAAKRIKEEKVEEKNYLVVTSVDREPGCLRLTAILVGDSESPERVIFLKDNWSSVEVKVNNLVCVINPRGAFSKDWTISKEQGKLIVEPLQLISPTSLTSFMFCPRKAVLQETFKMSGTNRQMLLGTIVHEVFQTALKRQLKRPTGAELMEIVKTEMLKDFIGDLVLLGEKLNPFFSDLGPYMENSANWLRLYAPMPTGFSKPLDKELNRMSKISGIEDYISNKVLGLKGKIDVTFNVANKESYFPLELKTGKSSKSFEHQTQVFLYVMMLQFGMNDKEVVPGWILYLKDLQLFKVQPKQLDIDGVLSMRNEMASYLSDGSKDSFPAIAKDVSMCRNCEQNMNCALVRNLSNDSRPLPANNLEFVNSMTSHLTEKEKDYANKWIKWQFMEWKEQKSRNFKAYLNRETLDIDNNSIFALAMQNTTSLLENNPLRKRIRETIIEMKPPGRTGITTFELDTIKEYLSSLDDSQKEAVFKCLAAKDFAIVQGLPGAGKTTTICAFIQAAVLLGRSVLVTAHTNSAVDNVLLKLIPLFKDPSAIILRVGSEKSVHPGCQGFTLQSKLEYICSSESSTDDVKYVSAAGIMKDTPVVISTCLMCASHPLFSSRTFDYCVVDEASQVVENISVKPLMISNAFILVGDNKQLSPLVVNKEASNEGMGVSLMERMLKHHGEEGFYSVVLDHQYRMNQEICALSSSLFYNNRLVCANQGVAESVIRANLRENVENVFPETMWKVLSSKMEDSVVFIDTYSKKSNSEFASAFSVATKSRFNAGEANFVVNLCKTLMSNGVFASEIGIISPYKGQVDFITKKLKAQLLNYTPECSTIDSFQGRDKDVIILSLVDGGPEGKQKSPDLLSNPRRLNVALTRAKVKLVMVGCRKTLSQSPLINQLLEKLKNNLSAC